MQSLSGFSPNKPEQFTHVNSSDFICRAEQNGHQFRSDGAMNQGVPGQYNASHAEKQFIVNDPNANNIDVSRPQCTDCQKFFIKEAQLQNRPITITDPDIQRTFMPDGKVVVKPRGD